MKGDLASLGWVKEAWAGILSRAQGGTRVEATAEDGRVRLRLPWPGREVVAADLPELLRAGPFLPTGVRLAISGGGGLCLECEVSLGADAGEEDWKAALSGALRLLEQAGGKLVREGEARVLEEESFPAGVADLLREDGGWAFHERGDALVVDLDTADGLLQARLTARGDAILAGVEVWRGEEMGAAPVAQAMGGLLLSVAGGLRLVRACAASAGEEPGTWFEVSLPRERLRPSHLGDALGCLSLAWEESAEESLVLQSPDAACRYLTIRGWAAGPGNQQQVKR